jgi:hypothetical protein
MSIISDSPTMKAPKETSAPQNTSVGSGSRPTPSRMKIDTSAPMNARTLGGRGDVPGALGMGKRVEDVR